MFCKIFYTNCSEIEIESLVKALPITHAFGDEVSILEDSRVLHGQEQHDTYYPRTLRKKTRVHTFVFDTFVNYVGGYGPYQRKAIREHPVIVALTSVPDWSAKDLDIEDSVLVENKPEWPVPIGSRFFHGPNYSRMVYLDFCVAFEGLKSYYKNHKLWIKIAPLAMGPTISTAEKVNIFAYAAPWYTQGLAMAIQHLAKSSWIYAIELIDFTGTLTGLANFLIPPEGVQIIVPSNRDILDFTACPTDVLPACIAPVDSFCGPWKKQPSTSFENIASCIVNNTNIIYDQNKTFQYVKL